MTTGQRHDAEDRSFLRLRAEGLLLARADERSSPPTAAEDLIRELEVHQIELGLQAEELMNAQTELEASRDRFRALFDAAPVGYVTLDVDGRIVEVNERAVALLGFDRARLFGRPLARFFDEDAATTLHLHQRAVQESGTRQTCRARLAHASGAVPELQLESMVDAESVGRWKTVLFEVTSPRKSEDPAEERKGHLARINDALVAEITERQRLQGELLEERQRCRQIERLLQQERDFSRSLIEQTPAAVLVLDRAGCVVRYNSHLARLTECPLRDVQGQDWFATFDSDEARASARESFEQVLRSGGISRDVTPLVTKGGTVRQIEWHRTALEDDAGEIVGALAIGRDVTDEDREIEERGRAERMSALGVLSSEIAHDFNNVLMGIVGCAELALGRLSGHDNAYGPVEQIKAAALSGAAVVGRLLAFAGRRGATGKVLNLNSLVARMDTMLRHFLGESVELQIALLAEAARVSCQPAEIEQLVVNLCINARKAMPHGGQVSVTTREVTVTHALEPGVPSDLDPGEYVMLEVADTGTGMDAETQRRIFEPFFTTRKNGDGTGLGLSSAYATALSHGGTISVHSELGRGSRFGVFLPRSLESSGRSSVAPDALLGAQAGGEVVFVLEDEPLVRLTICHYLERHGYRVIQAASQDEVMDRLVEHTARIDVVLCDVSLRGRSGPEVAADVLRRHPEASILYMSAYLTDNLVADGRVPGEAATIQKPFSESALVSRVRGLISEASQRTSVRSRLRRATGARPRVLLVEDQHPARWAIHELLADQGYEVIVAATGTEGWDRFVEHAGDIDVLVIDVGLPDLNGIELATKIRGAESPVGVVFLSGRYDHEATLFDELRRPGTAFLEKPILLSELSRTIDAVIAGSC